MTPQVQTKSGGGDPHGKRAAVSTSGLAKQPRNATTSDTVQGATKERSCLEEKVGIKHETTGRLHVAALECSACTHYLSV